MNNIKTNLIKEIIKQINKENNTHINIIPNANNLFQENHKIYYLTINNIYILRIIIHNQKPIIEIYPPPTKHTIIYPDNINLENPNSINQLKQIIKNCIK